MRIPEIAIRDGSGARDPVAFGGEWSNELGSRMTLTVHPDGRVEGTYETAVGAPRPGERLRLTGWAAGDLLSFTVDFGAYGSLATWAGQHATVDGREEIRTLWHLVVNVPESDEPIGLWADMLTGADSFYRAG